MKKNLLFAALAASVMVSCSNDDIVDVNHGERHCFSRLYGPCADTCQCNNLAKYDGV